MPVLHAIILGIAQGLSEFLPISSSGHLLIIPKLFGWTELTRNPSIEKSFDVALHIGSLLATMVALRHECRTVLRGAWHHVTNQRSTSEATLARNVLIATIPAAAVGAIFEDLIDEHLGKPILVGAMLVIFGLVLLWADQQPATRGTADIGWRDALTMGCAQALALQPGVSRSGITMTAGRFRNLDRRSAARFSFLLLIPVTLGAGIVKGAKLISSGGIPKGFEGAFLWGTVASAITGFLAIALLLRLLSSMSFRPFVVYRVIAGLATIAIFATGVR